MTGNKFDDALSSLLRFLKASPGLGTGWIRTMRAQRGMQAKQLAKIMQVSPARISVLEKDEQRGAVTLKMMQKAADALDCTFVYALVPRPAQQASKPRVRLDSTYMRGDRDHRLDDLEREYERSLAETRPD